MPRISSKNQLTVPVRVLEEAGLAAGDEVVVVSAGDGEVIVRRRTTTYDKAFGSFTGMWPPDYLEQLDREEEERSPSSWTQTS